MPEYEALSKGNERRRGEKRRQFPSSSEAQTRKAGLPFRDLIGMWATAVLNERARERASERGEKKTS